MTRRIWETGWAPILLILLACSGWERNNPLDPQNPATHGRVTDVRVVSLKHDVTVSWEPVQLEGMRRYHILRKADSQTDYERIGSVEGNMNFFKDSGRPYDQSVKYQITAETETGYESPPSDSIVITPGPLTYWMLDYYNGSVIRITHDGRHRLAYLSDIIWPTAAASDTAGKVLWVVDYLNGALLQISEAGKILKWIEGLDHPIDIAFDPLAREIWVVNKKRSEIVCFDSEGAELSRRSDVEDVRAVTWSGQKGECWILDRGLRKVGLIARTGEWRASCSLRTSTGHGLDCFLREGWVWAADSLDLVSIDRQGNIMKIVEMKEPVGALSVNQTNGDCWVVLNDTDGHDAIARVTADGDVLVNKDGFLSALSLAANPWHLGCFVAEAGRGRLVMLGADGNEMAEMTGIPGPWEIVNE